MRVCVYALVVFVVNLRMAAAYVCDCRGFWTLIRQESLLQLNARKAPPQLIIIQKAQCQHYSSAAAAQVERAA